MFSEETTIPDEGSDVSTVTCASEQRPSTSVSSVPTSGGSGAWSAVVQGYSDVPEIKECEVLLEEIKKKKADFLGNKYYNPERPQHKTKLETLDGKIKEYEEEIQKLNEALLDEL